MLYTCTLFNPPYSIICQNFDDKLWRIIESAPVYNTNATYVFFDPNKQLLICAHFNKLSHMGLFNWHSDLNQMRRTHVPISQYVAFF